MSTQQPVALITGAARGIGRATAERFAQDGYNLVLWDLSSEGLEAAAKALKSDSTKVMVQKVNVTDSKAVSDAIDAAEAELGPIEVVINNAGVTADAMLHKMDDDAFDKVINVNLKGVFLVGREAGKRMRDRGKGVILNTASVVAHYGNVGQSNYVATKAGVVGMTQTWAKELGPKGVRVNAVAPGFTATEMVQTVPEKILSHLKGQTPLRRLAEPSEIAAAFSFLASDQAAFITGHTLRVDGGLQT